MTPSDLPEANTRFGPPEGHDESHCGTVMAFAQPVKGGPWDGTLQIVVAWEPSMDDIERLKAGGKIYLTALGSLPPHYLSTTFEDATVDPK